MSWLRNARILFAAGAIGVLATPGAALPPIAPPTGDRPALAQGPRISFERTDHQYGVITDLEPFETSFGFTNTGSQDLVIEHIEADCGCTTPELTKTVYAPGESGVIEVHYDPAHKNGSAERRIAVVTNDPQRRTTFLRLLGTVNPVVFARPEMLSMTTEKGRPVTKRFEVVGRMEGFEVTGVTFSHPDLFEGRVVETKPVRARGGETLRGSIVEVTFLGQPSIGQIPAKIILETNDQRRATFEVDAPTKVIGDVFLRPTMVRLKGVTPGEYTAHNVMLRSRADEPFEIEGIEVTDNLRAEWTIDTLDPDYGVGKVVRFRFATPEGMTGRSLSGDITFLTKIPGEERITMPYYIETLDPALAPPTGLAPPAPPVGTERGDG